MLLIRRCLLPMYLLAAVLRWAVPDRVFRPTLAANFHFPGRLFPAGDFVRYVNLLRRQAVRDYWVHFLLLKAAWARLMAFHSVEGSVQTGELYCPSVLREAVWDAMPESVWVSLSAKGLA